METKELYLKTVFCCMACDGDIAKEEIELLNTYANREVKFEGLDIKSIIDSYVKGIKNEGELFLHQYLKELCDASLSKEEEMEVVKLAIETIEADKKIEYSEVSFFKQIRSCIKLTDQEILEKFPGREDFLLPDIKTENKFAKFEISFQDIKIDTNLLKN